MIELIFLLVLVFIAAGVVGTWFEETTGSYLTGYVIKVFLTTVAMLLLIKGFSV